MNQLSQVASISRKVIKYGSLTLVMMMIMRGMFGVAYKWWKITHPDPPPPPDVGFGKLPKLQFPKTQVKSSDYSYQLETPTGALPTNLDKQIAVYFMPVKKPNLLAYDEAKNLARQLNFINEPLKLSESKYQWTGQVDGLPSKLTIDIITGAFKLEKKWQVDNSFLTPSMIISQDKAVQILKNQLSRLNLLVDDLDKGESKVSFWKVKNNQLVPAIALSKAQFVKVNLFRAAIQQIPVLTISPDKGLVRALIGLQKSEKKQIVDLEFKYFPVDKSQKAIYPLIGVSQAWQRLQAGKAYVAQKPQSSKKEIAISNIYLAYYDAEEPQEFLQPIYVFEGESFRAYVPAIADEWVSE